VLATGANTSIEDAIAARGAPCGFSSIRPTNGASPRRWSGGGTAGSPVIALTVDTLSLNNWETLARLRQRHPELRRLPWREPGAIRRATPNFDGIDLTGATSFGAPNMSWDSSSACATGQGKLLLKGILAHEDAVLAARPVSTRSSSRTMAAGSADPGARRSTPCRRSSSGRRPHAVLVDSASAGTDIVKALALAPARLRRAAVSVGLVRSVSPASSVCSKSCAKSCAPRCNSLARPRSRISPGDGAARLTGDRPPVGGAASLSEMVLCGGCGSVLMMRAILLSQPISPPQIVAAHERTRYRVENLFSDIDQFCHIIEIRT